MQRKLHANGIMRVFQSLIYLILPRNRLRSLYRVSMLTLNIWLTKIVAIGSILKPDSYMNYLCYRDNACIIP